jgi:hypothetical protein
VEHTVGATVFDARVGLPIRLRGRLHHSSECIMCVDCTLEHSSVISLGGGSPRGAY